MPAGDGKVKMEGAVSSPVGPLDNNSQKPHARAPYQPSGSVPDQPTLSVNQAALRDSSSIMLTYQPMIQLRTTRIKIPNAHPSDLPPDFQQRLQQLLARGGQEGAGRPTGQPGSSAPGPTPHPRLRAVYVREGCIELLLRTEDWGGVAPARGESAEAAGSVGLLRAAQGTGDGGGDSTAHGDRPSALGCWVAGPTATLYQRACTTARVLEPGCCGMQRRSGTRCSCPERAAGRPMHRKRRCKRRPTARHRSACSA